MKRLAASFVLAASVALPAFAQAPQPAPSASLQAQQGAPAQPGQPRPHNLLLFVADGLRRDMVSAEHTPAMWALAQRGVRFTNTHSLFPTFTTANASGMATGHGLGDTGDFSNTIFTGFPVPSAHNSVTPFLEHDGVLGDVDEHFGDYINEETILRAARTGGFGTAAIGKLGPTLIFAHTDRAREDAIIIDDSTGRPSGVPLSPQLRQRFAEAKLAAEAPTRGQNGMAGNYRTTGTTQANLEQQAWFAEVATRVALPTLRARNQPFAMVFWSRDPDGTQHNQGDSFGKLEPGINGPTSLAAIRNADEALARLQQALREQGLEDSTDIIVVSDHGFSTISKESRTSHAAAQNYADVVQGQLPPGFLAIDLAHALGMKLFDPDNNNAEVAVGSHTRLGNGLIGEDPAHPSVVVAANGGSDLIYLPDNDKALATRIAGFLNGQDYTGGVFVLDQLGPVPGTLPLSAVNLVGSAVTPHPSMAISFRTFSTGCGNPTLCGVEIADTVLQQGQGMHGTFGRADTASVMLAAGPDFRRGLVDEAPSSNADVGVTALRVLGLRVPHRGNLLGRPLLEALADGEMPHWEHQVIRSAPDDQGRVALLQQQVVGETRYFDAAGLQGRVLGLPER